MINRSRNPVYILMPYPVLSFQASISLPHTLSHLSPEKQSHGTHVPLQLHSSSQHSNVHSIKRSGWNLFILLFDSFAQLWREGTVVDGVDRYKSSKAPQLTDSAEALTVITVTLLTVARNIK